MCPIIEQHFPNLRTTLFVIVLFFVALRSYAQGVNLGNPPVLNFSKKNFEAGAQTWDIDQDRNGVMWFANNDGLIEFDGIHWRLHPLGNGTIVRSVQTGEEGRVYAGGQGDFGYFAPDAQGKLVYQSLRSLIPVEEQNFSDVWDILTRTDGVFFRTNNQVFRFHGQKVEPLFPHGSSLFFMGLWGERLVVQDGNLFFYVYENGQFRRMEQPDAFKGGRISGILNLGGDTTLITTIQDGIFYFSGRSFEKWKTQDDAFLKTHRIYCAGLLPNGQIALGTSLNGVVTLDRQRRI